MYNVGVTTDASSWDWPLQHTDGVVKVINTDEKFQVGLDAGCFGPRDIDVRVNGYELIIHLRQKEKDNYVGSGNYNGIREVHRTYKLPDDVDPLSVKSHLSNSRVLTISAKKVKL